MKKPRAKTEIIMYTFSTFIEEESAEGTNI